MKHLQTKYFKLLFVDDKFTPKHELFKKLTSCFEKITQSNNIEDSIDFFDDFDYDIIILNYHLTGSLELIKHVRETKHQIPIILLNNELNKNELLTLLDKNISGYIDATLDTEDILISLHDIMVKHAYMMEKIGDAYYCFGTKNIIYNNSKIALSYS